MPFLRRRIDTELPPSQVRQRIQEITRDRDPAKPEQGLMFAPHPDPYKFVGTVNESSFSLCRIIGYRNSFIPFIKGTIIERGTGSRVQVKMHIHTFIGVFLLAWVIGMASAWMGDGVSCFAAAVSFLFLVTCAFFYVEALSALGILRSAVGSARAN